ncbi:MAG: efflux RND transporter permease subunit [Synechococcales cyanobacterium RM1_1_8]|nr:efflux RND transporter permease subunit [Synechococcales cyanobacterium RM1_1_8]
MAQLKPQLEQVQRNWPQGYGYGLGGEVAEQAETFASAGRSLALAILLVFAVLALQLQSFAQPLIILLSVPFALVGVIWGFYWTGIAFSFTAFVGIIAMVGIVVNDAIVMVDTMNRRQAEGERLRDAALGGLRDRFRPILTTSLTTIVSLIPLALTNPTWLPLASAIIFGLTMATVTALVIIPCLYLLLSPRDALSGLDF